MAGKPTRLAQSLTTVLAASGGVVPVATLPTGEVPPLAPSSLLPLGATAEQEGATAETDEATEQNEVTEGTGEPVTLLPPPVAHVPVPDEAAPKPESTPPPVEKAPRKESAEDREKAAQDREKVDLEEAMTVFRSEWIRYAERQLGVDGAQDAMSEVWCRFWERRAEVSKPREWMYACLRNVIREMSDPAKRQEIHLAHLDPVPVESAPEPPRPDNASLDRLIELANLSDNERKALALQRDGYALRMIAKELDLTFSNTEKILKRARAKMREHLAAGNLMLGMVEE